MGLRRSILELVKKAVSECDEGPLGGTCQILRCCGLEQSGIVNERLPLRICTTEAKKVNGATEVTRVYSYAAFLG